MASVLYLLNNDRDSDNHYFEIGSRFIKEAAHYDPGETCLHQMVACLVIGHYMDF